MLALGCTLVGSAGMALVGSATVTRAASVPKVPTAGPALASSAYPSSATGTQRGGRRQELVVKLAPGVSLSAVTRPMMPYIGILVLMLLVIAFVPWFVLIVPRLLL